MMHEEFEQLAGYRVTYEDYHDIIEPMYMATTLSKEDFIETLNRKRFEYIPQESPEVLALEAELADIKAAIKETQYKLERYTTFYKEDRWDVWQNNISSCNEELKLLKRRAHEIKWILSL